jgi:hypothetical protein
MASSNPVDRETGRGANNTVSEEQDVGNRDHEQSPQVDNANNNNNNETVASSDQVEEQQDSSSPSKKKKNKKKKGSGGGSSPPKSQNKSSAVQQQYEAMTRAAGLSSGAARTGVKTNVGTPLQANTTKAHGSKSNEPKLVSSGPALQPLGGHTPNMQHLPQGHATGPMSLLRNVTQKAQSFIHRKDGSTGKFRPIGRLIPNDPQGAMRFTRPLVGAHVDSIRGSHPDAVDMSLSGMLGVNHNPNNSLSPIMTGTSSSSSNANETDLSQSESDSPVDDTFRSSNNWSSPDTASLLATIKQSQSEPSSQS